MKTKVKTSFRCQECGYSSLKWLGRCPDCGAWNTLVEEQELPRGAGLVHRALTPFSSDVMALEQVAASKAEKRPTGLLEFDRMMGGGVVPGSLVLLGGPPGIGKSTLMLQVASRLAGRPGRASPEAGRGGGDKVLYVSGEESLEQIKSRADRLGVKAERLFVVSETELSNILEAVQRVSPQFLVVDSVQTTYRSDLTGAPGSVGQVRECAAELLRVAKGKGLTVFLLGHVTKEGDIAGPRVLEHIVDTVLYFEAERHRSYRILRAHKNRFGPTSEIGLFEMRSDGLQEVANPSQIFLSARTGPVPGSVVVASVEGTRPLLLELQALVTRTNFGFPKRMVTGLDYNRALLLIAVLEKRLGLHLEGEDIFLNVVGGVRAQEPAIDLGIAVAIASSHRNQVADPQAVVLGEVGLAGEVRAVTQMTERVTEAQKLGFQRAIVPKRGMRDLPTLPDFDLVGVDQLSDALNALLISNT